MDPSRVAHVVPIVPGRVSAVHARLGDRVEAGARLVEVESVEVGLARASLVEVRALRDVAASGHDRQRRLRSEGITSERELVEAEGQLREAEARVQAAQSTLEAYGGGRGSGSSLLISSPIAGTIVEQHAVAGEAADTDAPVFVVADLSVLWVIGHVYEQDLHSVALGDEVAVTMRAHPGRVWAGRIDFVEPVIDEATRTVAVRVEMDNSAGELMPGMFGELVLQRSAASGSVLVAASAVQELEGRTVVFVPGSDAGQYAARPVVVRRTADGVSEISSGLEAGEAYVARGAFSLKSTLLAGELGHGHAH